MVNAVCAMLCDRGRDRLIVETVTPTGSGPDHPHHRFALHHGFVPGEPAVVRRLALPVRPGLLERLTTEARSAYGSGMPSRPFVVVPDLLRASCAVHEPGRRRRASGEIEVEPESLDPSRYAGSWRSMRRWYGPGSPPLATDTAAVTPSRLHRALPPHQAPYPGRPPGRHAGPQPIEAMVWGFRSKAAISRSWAGASRAGPPSSGTPWLTLDGRRQRPPRVRALRGGRDPTSEASASAYGKSMLVAFSCCPRRRRRNRVGRRSRRPRHRHRPRLRPARTAPRRCSPRSREWDEVMAWSRRRATRLPRVSLRVGLVPGPTSGGMPASSPRRSTDRGAAEAQFETRSRLALCAAMRCLAARRSMCRVGSTRRGGFFWGATTSRTSSVSVDGEPRARCCRSRRWSADGVCACGDGEGDGRSGAESTDSSPSMTMV